MSLFAFLHGLRSRWLGRSGKRARKAKTGRLPRRPRVPNPYIELLEDRRLMATLPAAIVDNTRVLDTGILGSGANAPAIAFDPLSPNRVVAAYAVAPRNPAGASWEIAGGIGFAWSIDQGQTWHTDFIPTAFTDPITALPANATRDLPIASKPSIAFDREHNFYITYTEHNTAQTVGYVMFQGFNFSISEIGPQRFTPQNVPMVIDQVLYAWQSADAAYNPVVAVDTNVPLFTDPTTGQVQTVSNAGEAIYVAWNTATGPLASDNVSSNIKIAASVDHGFTFTNEVYINDSPIYAPVAGLFSRESAPQIAFSQATADGRLAGNRMSVLWSESPNLTSTATPPPSRLNIETMNVPDIAPQTAIIEGTTGIVSDAFVDANNNHIPVTTTFFADVTSADFPLDFDTVADLDVTISLFHPNMDGVQITLISPDNRRAFLLFNHINSAGNVIGPNVGVEAGINLGIASAVRSAGHTVGTVFDDQALRPINDRFFSNALHPFIGHYEPEGGGGLAQFTGAPIQSLIGRWRLEVVDVRNNAPLTLPQSMRGWNLRFTSRVDPQSATTFGTNTLFPPGNLINDDNDLGINAVPATQRGNNDYPLKPAANPNQGIGPGAVLAIDNSLGSYSPYQGRIYAAYTGPGRIDPVTNPTTNLADNTDIFLVYSDDGGATWGPRDPITGALVPKRVNDDTVFDNFSEGNRPQFLPAIAVDPVTGTLALSYFDTRRDAARARSAVTLATSLDGGASFSPPQTLNVNKTAIDAITRQTIILEPIPINVAAATTVNNVDGVGAQQALTVFGGRVIPSWGGNLNAASAGFTITDTFIAAGPRLLGSTQGPITSPVPVDQHGVPGELYGTTGPDGTRAVDGFQINFDRPIDPTTLRPADIRVLFRSPNMPPSQSPTDLSSQVGQLTPLDPGTKPSINISDAVITEGNTGTPTAIFTVSLLFPMIRDITIRYETSDGTAVAGQDYVRSTGTITIPAGKTTARIAIPILPDGRAEGNETFKVTLFDATDNVVLDRRQGTAVLVDDDIAPLLSVGDVSVLEGTSGNSTAIFSVYLSSPSSQTLVVRYSTSEGTAAAGTDFTPVSGLLTFLPGETTKTIPVAITTDALPEPNELLSLDIFGAVGANLGRSRGTGTIIDDDSLQISVSDVTIREGNSGTTNAVFTVSLTSATSSDVTVTYFTADGTAFNPTDYLARSGQVTIPAGQLSATFAVPVVGNTISQDNRTFVVNLSNPTLGVSMRKDRGYGVILDDDASANATLTVSDAQAVEGDVVGLPAPGGSNPMTFNVTLPYPLATAVTVGYATNDGTAVANVDYTPVTGTLTIPAGQTTRPIVVNTIPNRQGGGTRQFSLVLSNAQGASLARGTGIGTIVDDDAQPSITISDAITAENNNAILWVSLSTTSLNTITVEYTTQDGSATIGGGDYRALAGTLTFLPGEITQQVTLTTRSDGVFEGNEDFFVTLSNPSGAFLARPQGRVQIMDDGPGILLSDSAVREADGGTNLITFTVFLDRPAPTAFVVDYTTVDGTATAASNDYAATTGQLRFNQGDTSAIITVPVFGDRNLETDETFTLRLSNPTHGVLLRSQANGLIVDDDTPGPSFAVSDAAGVEGDAATFTVTLGFASPVVERVDYTAVSGSATAGFDFNNLSGTLVFQPGETVKAVRIPLVGDAQAEGLENFFLQLSSGTGRISRGRGTGSITDQRPGNIELAINDAVQVEGYGQLGFRIVLTQPAPTDITLSYATIDGTATAADLDYSAVFGQAVIRAGRQELTILVDTLTNNKQEPAGNMTLQLGPPTTANGTPVTVLRSSATGTIIDRDVRIFMDDTSGFETNAPQRAFPLTFRIDRPVPNPKLVAGAVGRGISVILNSTDGPNNDPNAATSGGNTPDFQRLQNQRAEVLFGKIVSEPLFPNPPAPPPYRPVQATIFGDGIVEPNEFFYIDITGKDFGELAKPRGTVLIVDDDTAGPVTTIGNASETERLTTGDFLDFPVYVSNFNGSVTIRYTTADGSALDRVDYAATSGQIVVAGGTVGTIRVPLFENGVRDSSLPAAPFGLRTLSMNITNVSAGGIGFMPGNEAIGGGRGTASGFRYDHNQFPNIVVGNGTVVESDTGTRNIVFPVTFSMPATFPVSFDIATVDGSAIAGLDYQATRRTVTFAAGTRGGTFTIPVIGDLTPEALESFTVLLSNAGGGQLVTNSVTGFIQDNDALNVSVTDATVQEGDSGQIEATFTISLSGVSANDVEVTYATTDKNAVAGSDYQALSGTVTIAAGQTQALLVVNVNGDLLPEPNEFFVVNLTGSTNAGIGRAQGLGVILDDDTLSVSVGDVAVTEGNSGTKNATFTVYLSNPVSTDVIVDYTTLDGSATTASGDYVARSGKITFAAGSSSATVIVPINGDQLPEQNETFFLDLTSTSRGTIARSRAMALVVNDDATVPNLSVSDASGFEGGNVQFTIFLNFPASENVVVQYSTADGTGLAGTDYTAVSGTVTIPLGQTSATFTVPTRDNVLLDGNRTFKVNVSSSQLNVFRGQGVGTIIDNDSLGLSISDATVVEGNEGGTTATFTVYLTAPTENDVTFRYRTTGGTAVATEDYLPDLNVVTIPAGATAATFTVTVLANADPQSNRTVEVTIDNAVGAALQRTKGTLTIVDDDVVTATPPALSLGDQTVRENAGRATFTVFLSQATDSDVTVEYTTSNGAASAGSDYVAAQGTVLIPAGQTSATFTVDLRDDNAVEGPEDFRVTLSNPLGATLARDQATGTIIDDDVTPFVTIGAAAVREGNSGSTKATLTLLLNRPGAQPITVFYSTANGTALAGSDYTSTTGNVTIPAGTTIHTFTVDVLGDTLIEGDEDFVVNLTGILNGALRGTSGLVTIIDDETPTPSLTVSNAIIKEGDAGTSFAEFLVQLSNVHNTDVTFAYSTASTPQVTIGDVTVAEGNVGTSLATFTVYLSSPTFQAVTLDYATGGGNALPGLDYVTTSGTVTVPAGATQATFTVPIVGNSTPEGNRNFFVNLSRPTGGAVILRGQSTATIVDDDALRVSVGDAVVREGDLGTTTIATFTVYLNAPSPLNNPVRVTYTSPFGTGQVTVPAGQTTQTFNLNIPGNALPGPNVPFNVSLSNPTVGVLGRATGQGLIVDDDTSPGRLTVGDATIQEGALGTTGAISFKVFLIQAVNQVVTVDYSTVDDTAVGNTDYLPRNGTITFLPGQTEATITVPVVGNNLVDGNRQFFLDLANASNGIQVLRARGAGTIIDDDIAAPFVSVGDVTVQKAGAGLTPATFQIFLSTPSNQPVTVRYQTVDGNASGGLDYVTTTGTVTFVPGQTVATVTVPVIAASVSQLLNQTFFLRLLSATNGVLRRDTGTATVVTSATATPGQDFTPSAGTGVIRAGETSVIIQVPILGDRVLEPNESLFLNILSSTNSFIVRDRGTGVIVDDEYAPYAVSVGDATSFEGSVATFTVYLNKVSPLPISVLVSTLDGTARAGIDYEAVSQLITFAPGETAKTFNVSFLDNTNADGNKTFSVNLDSVNGANFDRGQGVGRIIDNDTAPASVSVGDLTFTETAPLVNPNIEDTDNDVTRYTVFFTVYLSTVSTQNVIVDVETIDGTAKADIDYVPTKTSVIIPAGLTTSSFTVDILGDVESEGFENFTVKLSNARTQVTGTAVPIVGETATGTIIDDDELNGATKYLVRFTPQAAVGTYSYGVSTQVTDRIRSDDRVRGPVDAAHPAGLNAAIYNSIDVPKLISGTQTSTTFSRITVPQQPFGTTIADVNLRLNLTHTRTADLVITLIAPDNTRTVLFDGPGLFSGFTGPNVLSLINTVFDDEARQGLTANAAPFTGTFHPVQELSKLIGKDPSGIWTLQIDDTAVPNAGSLDSWSLDIVTGNNQRTPINSLGNYVDQDNDGVTAEVGVDEYAVPKSVSGVPFTLPYTTDTFPLIVPGPRIVQIKTPGQTSGNEALFLNRSADAVDIIFDRDMDPTSFTVDDVLRLTGPLGNIPLTRVRTDANGRPVLDGNGQPILDPTISIIPNPPGTPVELAKRTFRLVLPATVRNGVAVPDLQINGAYSLALRPDIFSAAGDALDTNQNAGLENLRGGTVNNNSVTIPINVSNTTPVVIQPNSRVQSQITVTDPFVLQGLTLRLNITHPFVPDLSAELFGPDGTLVRLFSNVGALQGATNFANFSNTLFDDNAATPIQLGVAPFDIGAFKPQTPLSDLRNKGSAGTYTLRITNRGTRAGTLTNWSLTLQKPQLATGLGEPSGDSATVPFRIFIQDPTNPITRQVWTAVGPASQDRNGVRISGRITAIAVDPSDTSGNTVYVGAATGGLWKTTNFLTDDPNGPTYLPLTDLGPRAGLNISSIVVIPVNNDPRQSIILATTGEGDINGSDPRYGFPRSSGVGFLRSINGGLSWEVLDSARNYSGGARLPIGNRQFEFVGLTAFKIIADPVRRADGGYTLYAAFSGAGNPNQGIWRSDDTGNTWTQLRQGDATDVALAFGSRGSNGQAQVIYGAFRGEGVFLSQNRGVDWRRQDGGNGNPLVRTPEVPPGQLDREIPVDVPATSPSGAKGRISLAVPAFTGDPLKDSSYQGWLYALVSTPGGGLDGVYLTKDFGANWTPIRFPRLDIYAPPRNLFDYSNSGFATNDESPAKGNHDLLQGVTVNGVNVFNDGNDTQSIVVDPLNPNVVYVGGTDQRQRLPVGGLVRIDTTGIVDGHAFYAFNNSDPDGGLTQGTTSGGVTATPRTEGIYHRDPVTRQFILDNRNPYLNLFRDPDNPFLENSTVLVTDVGRFANDGSDVKIWQPFSEVLEGVSGVHRMLALPDPQTGGTRLFIGTDEGVFSGVDKGDGTFVKRVGLQQPVAFGSRNGNLQTAQMNEGATQPSVLAAEISRALFYGSAKDTGIPRSAPDILQTGNLLWVGPDGSAMGAATDLTGSGTLYQYRFPCCGDDIIATDFFQVEIPPNPSIGRTGNQGADLFAPGDNPNADAGQWPLRGGGKFAVNTINKNAIAISGIRSGRVYRTLDGGVNWFVIADPADVGGAYAPAIAFGAPDPGADVGNLDNYLFVGNTNGQVFVTTTGGGGVGGNAWRNITGVIGSPTGLDGSPIVAISTDPTRGSKRVYVATQRGIYYNANALSPTPTWRNITGLLFSANRAYSFGIGSELHPASYPALTEVTAFIADWRFAIPTSDGQGPTPVLYVGTDGGVFRSDDRGGNWRLFPSARADGAPADGGFLPNVRITELELASGNIDPATGRPDGRFGFNLLVAHTYGRGTWVIRADTNSIPGPAVVSVTPAVAPSGTDAVDVVFSGAVDPNTFSLADVVSFFGPNGQPLTPRAVTDVTPPPAPGQPNAHNVYRISFDPLTVDGIYQMTIGPNISDYGGNLMNQNGNGINGENPADRFTFQFLINSNDNGRFLSGMYHDNFNRGADLAGFSYWLPTLDDPRFALLGPIASALVYDPNPANPAGARARTQLIRDLYSSVRSPASYLGIGDLLGEAATDGEVNFWLDYLRNVPRPDIIIFDLLRSDRYFLQDRDGHRIAGDIDAYVTAIIRDAFGRDPFPDEQTVYGNQLKSADTSVRMGIANTLVLSTEYYTQVIQGAYNRYLARAASTDEVNVWLNRFQQLRLTQQQLFASLLGSDEYFDRHPQVLGIAGPGTDSTYIKAVYQELFPGDIVSDGEVNYWLGRFASDTSHEQFVNELLVTDRYRVGPGYGLIDQLYQALLDRTPGQAERDGWRDQFHANPSLRTETIQSVIVSSQEYINLNKGVGATPQQANVNWTNAAYNELLGRTTGATQDELDSALAQISSGLFQARTQLSLTLVNSQEFTDRLVGRAYQTYLGRSISSGELVSWRAFLQAPVPVGAQSRIEMMFTAIFSSREYFNRQVDSEGVHSNDAWVRSVFFNLRLGSDQAGQAAALATILEGYRPQRVNAATAFVFGAEARIKFIRDSYQSILGRAPVSNPFDELQFWLGQMNAGMTLERMQSILIGSQEFFNNSARRIGSTGSPTNTTFIQATYTVVYGVLPTTDELNAGLAQLNAGVPRDVFALQQLTSDRYRFDRTSGLVTRLYQQYLQRAASLTEINFWRTQYQQPGFRTELLIIDLLASINYFTNPHPFP